MPRFVSDDPAEFLAKARYIEFMLHHEAGHLLLAHYYGFLIGGFSYKADQGNLGSAIRNKPSPAINAQSPQVSAAIQARKLLAGELAGRIRAGIPTDEITIDLLKPKAETLSAQTSFADIWPTVDQRRDAIRVIRLIHDLQVQSNWWTWVWDRHEETKTILHTHWPMVEELASRLVTIPPPDGKVDGNTLIAWCREIGVPLHDPANVPVSY